MGIVSQIRENETVAERRMAKFKKGLGRTMMYPFITVYIPGLAPCPVFPVCLIIAAYIIEIAVAATSIKVVTIGVIRAIVIAVVSYHLGP